MEIWILSIVSVVLIIAAGIGGYCIGRNSKQKTMRSYSGSLISYDCVTKEAKVNMSDIPQHIAAYGWDNTSGGAVPGAIPPTGSAVVTGAIGNVTIPNVPHENNVVKILLQIWAVDSLVESPQCDSGSSSDSQSSSSSGSSSSGGGSRDRRGNRSPSPVLP